MRWRQLERLSCKELADKTKQGPELLTELKMLRFSLRVTRMGKIRNKYIRVTAQVEQFEHVWRRDGGYIR